MIGSLTQTSRTGSMRAPPVTLVTLRPATPRSSITHTPRSSITHTPRSSITLRPATPRSSITHTRAPTALCLDSPIRPWSLWRVREPPSWTQSLWRVRAALMDPACVRAALMDPVLAVACERAALMDPVLAVACERAALMDPVFQVCERQPSP
jgi:hypothetical protein